MVQNPYVDELVQSIISLCDPQKVYIFSMKYDLQQLVIGFKLCIVGDTPDKRKLEQDIYLSLDCQVPYDVVIYTTEEWEQFSVSPNTFAYSIREKGVLVYDKATA